MILSLERIHRTAHQLHFLFALDDYRFSHTIYYTDLDLRELERRHPDIDWARLYFHIAAFELNKWLSFRPTCVDFGAYSRYCTPEFLDLWLAVFHKVWAQWRYENGLADCPLPRVETGAEAAPARPASPDLRAGVLNFCGGGKDSLVASRLFAAAQVPYWNLFYSASAYGTHALQHRDAQPIYTAGAPTGLQRVYVFEDFTDAPLIQLLAPDGVETVAAAETPASVFTGIPAAIAAGTKYMSLAHEKSADSGQVHWPLTGESVNHQWGKSLDCETLLNEYLNEQLIDGLEYFSVLKPIYDLLIFSHLRTMPHDEVLRTSSCNIRKPWCLNCPKCAYVFLGYAAFLPDTIVRSIFPRNALDDPDLLPTYRDLAGLTGALPFECIGQADETRLMLLLCGARGFPGRVVETLCAELRRDDLAALRARYTTLYWDEARVPAWIRDRLEPILTQTAADTRRFIDTLLAAA